MGRKYPSDKAERRRVKRADGRLWRVELTEDLLDGGYFAECVDLPGCVLNACR